MDTPEILYHLTVAALPNDLVTTTRGQIPYAQWVEEERERIVKKSGWPLIIHTNPKTGEISLAHLRIRLKG